MFGLPLVTTFVAFGIPVLIAVGLLWWGMRVRLEDQESDGKPEDHSS